MLLEKFKTYAQTLFKPEEKILLTVSGGKDSVVMFDLFLNAGFRFGVAHCNFQLRGEDSIGDEEFVQNIAHNQGINFHSIRFDTKEFAHQKAISTQMAARELRYEWFEKIRIEGSYDFVATAHHLNDNIETILLNLTKGTGVAGLRGIQAKNGHIIRPLLFATREEIEEYVSVNNLSWREDSSNASTDYQRNLLRHEVIPVLKRINPNLEETFSRNIDRFHDLEMAFQKNLNYFKTTVLRQEGDTIFIKISNLKYWQSTTYLLEETLKDYGFNYQQIKAIEQSLHGHSGKQFFSPTHVLVKDREDLVISRRTEDDFEEVIIEEIKPSLSNNPSQPSPDGEGYYALEIELPSNHYPTEIEPQRFDLDKIKFPLTLRKWQQGDWFIPLGMKGKKKISDFLIDRKIPLHLKKVTFTITSQYNIIWVVGQRIDDRFKITPATKRVLEIRIR
jgi:tRNA(Ile)-lysidine synthase